MPAINTFTRKGVVEKTTNATQTIAAVFSTANWLNASFGITVEVLARQTDNINETGHYYRTATFKRNAGTLTQVGSTRTWGTDDESVAGWDATIDMGSATVIGTTTGDYIRVLVTGAVGDTVDWNVIAEVRVNDGQFGQDSL